MRLLLPLWMVVEVSSQTITECSYKDLQEKFDVMRRDYDWEEKKDTYPDGESVRVYCTNDINYDKGLTRARCFEGTWMMYPMMLCKGAHQGCSEKDLEKDGVRLLETHNENKFDMFKNGAVVPVMCLGETFDNGINVYKATCNEDDTWSFDPELQCQEPEPLQCSYKDLQEKFNVEKLDMEGMEEKEYYDDQESCTVYCPMDYSQASMATCNAGEWIMYPMLECPSEPDGCLAEDLKKDGVRPMLNMNKIYTWGSVIPVICVDDKLPTGSNMYEATCNKDNTWSYDKELQCEDKVKCSMGDLYEYGVQTIGRPKDKYVSPGFEIQVMCAGTTSPTEEHTATCVDDGSWEFSPELNCAIVCHIHELKKFGVWPSSQPENKYIKPGQEIKVMCHDTDGPDYAASCNKDGSWSFAPELECLVDPKPLEGCNIKELFDLNMHPYKDEGDGEDDDNEDPAKPPKPTRKPPMKLIYKEGESVTATCQEGYVEENDMSWTTATCNKNSDDVLEWVFEDEMECVFDETCDVEDLHDRGFTFKTRNGDKVKDRYVDPGAELVIQCRDRWVENGTVDVSLAVCYSYGFTSVRPAYWSINGEHICNPPEDQECLTEDFAVWSMTKLTKDLKERYEVGDSVPVACIPGYKSKMRSTKAICTEYGWDFLPLMKCFEMTKTTIAPTTGTTTGITKTMPTKTMPTRPPTPAPTNCYLSQLSEGITLFPGSPFQKSYTQGSKIRLVCNILKGLQL